ncbi:MAG: hypothetical protein K8M05_24470 [Deltaproteobacteria bacterium]|nr:hypothetical protein [Kofleriaceae bacterium]
MEIVEGTETAARAARAGENVGAAARQAARRLPWQSRVVDGGSRDSGSVLRVIGIAIGIGGIVRVRRDVRISDTWIRRKEMDRGCDGEARMKLECA